MKQLLYGNAAQQAHEADPLIEDFIVACPSFAAFCIASGVTAKPACGLCATVSQLGEHTL